MPSSAGSQFPTRTPSRLTPFTRRMPAARSGLRSPQSDASYASRRIAANLRSIVDGAYGCCSSAIRYRVTTVLLKASLGSEQYRQEDWTTAIMILVAMSRWYGEQGRLEDLELTIDLLLPHATGMERVVLRGQLVTIATNRGDYRTGLTENQQLEADLQGLAEDSDYYRNLHSAITQQIDCLVELDQLDEAERRWRDADALIPYLEENRVEAQARLLGQLANLRREQNQTDAAIDAASQAVQHAVANHCPDVLIAELRNTKADVLRLAGRDREALDELNVVSGIDMPPGLRSRFLHLKALLLKHYGAPQALEHLLESYQNDRLRGDAGGVAISLLAIARIFTEDTSTIAHANASGRHYHWQTPAGS